MDVRHEPRIVSGELFNPRMEMNRFNRWLDYMKDMQRQISLLEIRLTEMRQIVDVCLPPGVEVDWDAETPAEGLVENLAKQFDEVSGINLDDFTGDEAVLKGVNPNTGGQDDTQLPEDLQPGPQGDSPDVRCPGAGAGED